MRRAAISFPHRDDVMFDATTRTYHDHFWGALAIPCRKHRITRMSQSRGMEECRLGVLYRLKGQTVAGMGSSQEYTTDYPMDLIRYR